MTTVKSRDGQWEYEMCGTSWVRTITHRPTGRTMPGRASLPIIRAMAANGELLARLDVCAGRSIGGFPATGADQALTASPVRP